MTLVISSLYASLVALIYIALSARVILYRRGNRISLGDAGDPALLQRVRAQANCGEYAPIALILLLISEIQGAPPLALHILGMMLLLGRLIHAIGFRTHPINMNMRVVGMVLTLLMIIFASLGLLAHAVF